MATKIFAQRYNNLQNRIKAILGNPTTALPNTGYGQTVTSSQVSIGTSKVQAADYTAIAADMAKARYHQVGSSFGGIDPVIPSGTNRAKVIETYITSLESLMTQIETSKDLYSAGQMTVESLRTPTGNTISSSNIVAWNTAISFVFNVTFSSLANYRAFFNTGGEIRFSTTSNYSGTEVKSSNWKSLLAYIATVRFTPTQSIAANGSITSATGGRELTVNQTSTLVNYNSGSAVYASHVILVTVTRTSDTNLQFEIRLTDGPETIDETVKGTITTSPTIFRADGTLSQVSVPAPVGSIVSNY